ncbi:hypothetical protein SG34_010410 [Thalassomonas viridans]|uniref:Uncharacterized protein n=1 Tax=Thalassomonas viridans TaxID=137584 RepID=A0AAF0CAV0_9GAMM|nr:hypothetical protein [Thalassomonas viridans]WDE07258.1 hypothetical protein SG34_010410 [Thalassomonas viridans]
MEARKPSEQATLGAKDMPTIELTPDAIKATYKILGFQNLTTLTCAGVTTNEQDALLDLHGVLRSKVEEMHIIKIKRQDHGK